MLHILLVRYLTRYSALYNQGRYSAIQGPRTLHGRAWCFLEKLFSGSTVRQFARGRLRTTTQIETH